MRRRGTRPASNGAITAHSAIQNNDAAVPAIAKRSHPTPVGPDASLRDLRTRGSRSIRLGPFRPLKAVAGSNLGALHDASGRHRALT